MTPSAPGHDTIGLRRVLGSRAFRDAGEAPDLRRKSRSLDCVRSLSRTHSASRKFWWLFPPAQNSPNFFFFLGLLLVSSAAAVV